MNFSTSTSNAASQEPNSHRIRNHRYLKSLLTSFFACWLLFGAAAFAQIGASTPGASWIDGLYATRHHLADPIKKPKMLVVAGSSALFGVSAEMIQQTTQVPTINLGSHAGLGIDYLLHRAKEFAKPGDTILLAPEYELYMADYKRSNTLVGYVFAHDPGYILSNPKIIFELSLERLMYGIGVRLKLLPTIETSGYNNNLNENGDIVGNYESLIDAEKRAKLATVEPFPVKLNVLENPAAFQKLSKFLNWCRNNEVKVIATWPNTLWFDAYSQPKYQRLFDDIQKFYQKSGVIIAGSSRASMYEKSWFYDTIYHLHARGVKARTEQLIAQLKPLLITDGETPKH
jgi:hypothetical protein